MLYTGIVNHVKSVQFLCISVSVRITAEPLPGCCVQVLSLPGSAERIPGCSREAAMGRACPGFGSPAWDGAEQFDRMPDFLSGPQKDSNGKKKCLPLLSLFGNQVTLMSGNKDPNSENLRESKAVFCCFVLTSIGVIFQHETVLKDNH